MIEKYDNGDWEEFELVNGKKQGKAIYHYSEKNELSREYEIRNYVDGICQGKAVLYYKNKYRKNSYTNKSIQENIFYYHYDKNDIKREYIDKIVQLNAIICHCAMSDREEFNYINGIPQGKAIYYKEKNYREEFNYVNGVRQGKALYYKYNGEYEEKEEHTYINGMLQGKAIHYYKKGNIEEKEVFNYLDNRKHGKTIHYYKKGNVEEKEVFNYINDKKEKVIKKCNTKDIWLDKEIENISKHFHKNGKLRSKITDYKKIRNIKKINPYFDEKYADEIKRVWEIYDINGVIESVTGYSGFDDTDFKSQEIIYNAGKIDCVKTYFKNKIKKDYYENEKLKRTVLRKEIKGEWEDYKTIYYDENGNKKETVYEIEEEEGFFGRIFSGLGASLSEKIKETDVKETLININSALEKYKK